MQCYAATKICWRSFKKKFLLQYIGVVMKLSGLFASKKKKKTWHVSKLTVIAFATYDSPTSWILVDIWRK